MNRPGGAAFERGGLHCNGFSFSRSEVGPVHSVLSVAVSFQHKLINVCLVQWRQYLFISNVKTGFMVFVGFTSPYAHTQI